MLSTRCPRATRAPKDVRCRRSTTTGGGSIIQRSRASEVSWDGHARRPCRAGEGDAGRSPDPGGVAMYLASGSAFDSAGRRAAERFLRVLGSHQKYTATTIDTPSKPLVAELVGGWSGLTPVWDHERSTFAAADRVPTPSFHTATRMQSRRHCGRLRHHRARGGEVWVVDPVAPRPPKSPTATSAPGRVVTGSCWPISYARLLPDRGGTSEDVAVAGAGHGGRRAPVRLSSR